MPSRNHLFLAALAVFLVGMPLTFADWPPQNSWTDCRRGPELRGVAASGVADDAKLLWEVSCGDVTATPAIVDEKVYAGTLDGELVCFALAGGKTLWTYRTDPTAQPGTYMPAIHGGVVVTADSVIVGDAEGLVHAVNRATGKPLWQFKTEGEIVGGPNLLGEQLFVGSHDGRLYCLTLAGKMVWTFDAQGPINATPVVTDGVTVLTGCDKPVLRLVNVDAGQSLGEMPLSGLLIASAAAREGRIYFAQTGLVTAIDWKNRKELWTASCGNANQNVDSSPAVTDEFVVIGGTDRNVYCYDRSSGAEKWKFPTRGKLTASPVVGGDCVYIGSADKQMYAIRLRTGELVWKHNVSHPIVGSAAVANGCLVVGTDRGGGVVCFGKDPSQN